jgi:poly(A) polymerase
VVLDMFPRTYAVGAHFGVVLVATCGGADGADAPGHSDAGPDVPDSQRGVTEVATFRSDGAYSDGRHPDAVRYTKTAEEDVQRRDFTINGLLLDPLRDGKVLLEALGDPQFLRSSVIDYVGGLADLEAGVVRAIGRPELRFEEDHLRMLRGVRFAARFGFALDAATKRAMHSLAPRIAAVSRERVRDELTRMLTEGHARRAFELLDETGLLAEVLPEIAGMKGVEQPPEFHPEGDVWIHTLMLLEQLEPDCSMTLAWGALLHDAGKPPTFRRAADRIRFDGHVEMGVAIGAEICRRFRFSNEESRQILELIENHMRFTDAPRMKASTLKRFFRLELFEEHLALHRMDCLAASGNLDHWEFVRERWQAMPEEAVRPRPLITGRELIAAGYKPGTGFREMLRVAEDAQLEGMVATPEEALKLVRERFPL